MQDPLRSPRGGDLSGGFRLGGYGPFRRVGDMIDYFSET
jgi:hypothetical protein